MTADDIQKVLIATGAFILALANFEYTRRKTRAEVRRGRVVTVIDSLREKTREALEEMERHLGKEKGAKTRAEMFRINRACDRLITQLGEIVPGYKEASRMAFTKWYAVVFGEGFPMTPKMSAFDPASDRIRGMHAAQETFERALGCIDDFVCSSRFRG